MENRLRLGQFVTQRQGATFVENWVDGSAFNDIMKQQEIMNHAKEELDKERKLLQKKRPQLEKETTTKSTKEAKLTSNKCKMMRLDCTCLYRPELTVDSSVCFRSSQFQRSKLGQHAYLFVAHHARLLQQQQSLSVRRRWWFRWWWRRCQLDSRRWRPRFLVQQYQQPNSHNEHIFIGRRCHRRQHGGRNSCGQ